MSQSTAQERKVTWGCYIALAFAVVFFSGLLQSNQWYGVFDFTTLNGAFGLSLDHKSGESRDLASSYPSRMVCNLNHPCHNVFIEARPVRFVFFQPPNRAIPL